ncbi:uncharacterized protein LOC116266465 [Nymphaea colorata]|nr:uncharacterized protein LOC116266465 [Nymphaea colorata]
MGKYKAPLPNRTQEKRAQVKEFKRKVYGDPNTGKLKIKDAPLSISGKRKRKLFRRMWKEHKDALVQGLETMDDMEMAPVNAEGTSKDSSKSSTKFFVKKNVKLKLKKKKGKGKVLMEDSEPNVDAMEE